jgi:hypothetical protein
MPSSSCATSQIPVSLQQFLSRPLSPFNFISSEVNKVKHCPACNFSFPDFHIVCDFDGTDLICDPEPLSLVKSPPPSRFRRTLRSPLFWGGVLAFAAVSNAFLFALYDASSQSTPAVKAEPSSGSPALIGRVLPSAPAAESGPALNRKPSPAKRDRSRNVSPPLWHAHLARVPSLSARRRQPAKIARTPPRQEATSVATQPSRAVNPTKPAPLATISRELPNPNGVSIKPQESEVAQRKEPPQSSHEKDPRLVSMLKTTWRVLKKPFRF